MIQLFGATLGITCYILFIRHYLRRITTFVLRSQKPLNYHHFCLTRFQIEGWLELIGMPSVDILHQSDCAWLCCSLSQLKTWNLQYFFNNMIGKFCWKSWKTHDLKKQNFLLETLNFLLKTQNILFMNHIEIYGYFMLANFMLLSDGKNPWQMKPLYVYFWYNCKSNHSKIEVL